MYMYVCMYVCMYVFVSSILNVEGGGGTVKGE